MIDVLSIFRDDECYESITFIRGVEGLWYYDAVDFDVKSFSVVEEKKSYREI